MTPNSFNISSSDHLSNYMPIYNDHDQTTLSTNKLTGILLFAFAIILFCVFPKLYQLIKRRINNKNQKFPDIQVYCHASSPDSTDIQEIYYEIKFHSRVVKQDSTGKDGLLIESNFC